MRYTSENFAKMKGLVDASFTSARLGSSYLLIEGYITVVYGLAPFVPAGVKMTPLNAATFGWLKSTEYVIMVVFGGMGSIAGSVIAALILTALPEALREFSQYRMLVYSVALILVMIFKPTGLLGTYEFSLSKIIKKITGKSVPVKEKQSLIEAAKKTVKDKEESRWKLLYLKQNISGFLSAV